MKMNDAITKSVSNAYMKMKAEELTDKQKKYIDKNNNNKIDSHDFKLLRKEDNEVEEGWDDMMKAVKAKSGPQPSGGSGVKKGTRYGGSNQKDEPEVKEKPTAKTKKKPFSEMLQTYKSAGLKSLFEAIEEKAIAEESTNDEFKAELDDTQSKSTGKKKAEVAKAKVDAVQQEEVIDINDINGVKMSTIGEEEMTDAEKNKREQQSQQGVAEGLTQTLRKVVPGYAKREIDKKMDDRKFGRTDVDKDANYYRYKKIQDKIKNKGVEKGMAGFKEHYGDRAKSVMYATATKQAMKD